MRDLFIIAPILIMVPFILRKPQVGILAWVWISIMNPHRITYGWTYDYPLLDIIAGATLLSAAINFKNMQKVSFHPIITILILFYFWVSLTTVFAVDFDSAYERWLLFTKTLLLVALILLYMNKKHWIMALIGVFIVSIGYTGFKGGLYTLIYGGSARIWGPPGTGWGDNNDVSIVMLMAIPLILAMRNIYTRKLHRMAFLGVAITFFFTVLGTQSRGALVGLVGMSLYTAWRSKQKIIAVPMIFIALAAGLLFMPQSWKERMQTIQTYEQDGSASSRILQWKYAVQISMERPLFGSGFHARYYQPYYRKYMEGIDVNRAVHSNFFQILEEQGYIGIFMYLLLMATMIISSNRVSKAAKGRDDLKWAALLLYATQFSIIGYAFNGLTINQGYLEIYYFLLSFVVLLISQIKEGLQLETNKPDQSHNMWKKTS